MVTPLKILCVGNESVFDPQLVQTLRATGEITFAPGPSEAASLLASGNFQMVVPGSAPLTFGTASLASEAPPTGEARVPASDSRDATPPTLLSLTPAQLTDLARMVVDEVSDGLVLVDQDNLIVWSNHQFERWCKNDDVVGANFYKALGGTELLGPDFCPFNHSRKSGAPSTTVVRVGEGQFFQLRSSRVEDHNRQGMLVVAVRDVTSDSQLRAKMDQLRQAGAKLADLKPCEIAQMTVEERKELLKDNILHATQDLLNFDVVEIRLIEPESKRLDPLLAVGIDESAACRVLFAEPKDNGVTGFVAATGKSYLCEDTKRDPLYLNGLSGAGSSLTVPLVLHDEVIGSFNVESPERNAFSEEDLQLVEQFGRDLAISINTLNLLVAQEANAAKQSIDLIHSGVAIPIDEILNDTVNVMGGYIGHDPDVVTRLRSILTHARQVKQIIHQVGRQMAPTKAVALLDQPEDRPLLVNRRFLVIDADGAVRESAHKILEQYGCIVETAHQGNEAILMVRNSIDQPYDTIISDIKLPDMTGYQLMLQLQELIERPPLILMNGYGYDGGHTIVKARQAGLPAFALLYKPFRINQLLEVIEQMIQLHMPAEA
ncbi:MAG: response regulator [Pirellulaceae bacterium]